MIRKILLTLSFAPVLLLSACSYRYDFVVVNKSDGVIEVQYRLKQQNPQAPGKFVGINPPAKLGIKEFEKSEREWGELPKEQYHFDNLTGIFTVSVAPNEVLLLSFAYNYQGHDNEFALANIKITGAKGSIILEGRQAQTQFKIESDTKYVLQYR